MGSPDDRDALFFYNGVMEKLQEYFDDGTLVCTSGKLTFDDTAVMRSGRNTAKNDMAEILSQNLQRVRRILSAQVPTTLHLGLWMPWSMQDMCLERMAGL